MPMVVAANDNNSDMRTNQISVFFCFFCQLPECVMAFFPRVNQLTMNFFSGVLSIYLDCPQLNSNRSTRADTASASIWSST